MAFTLAVRAVDLGEDAVANSFGFDIDDACTCGTDACCASVPTCARPAAVDEPDWLGCDAADGIDANSPELFVELNELGSVINSEEISEFIRLGRGTVLLDVTGYNGEANDDGVRIGVYRTGQFSANCNETDSPNWDGHDKWPIDNVSAGVAASDVCGGVRAPSVYDFSAYVVDQKLVARFSSVVFAIQVGLASLRLRIVDAAIVAPLVRGDDGQWSVSGAMLSGRWPASDLFAALGSLDQASSVVAICDKPLASTQRTICSKVDAVVARPGDDSEAPCDSISFAAEFDAVEAGFGRVIELEDQPSCSEFLDLDCETPVE